MSWVSEALHDWPLFRADNEISFGAVIETRNFQTLVYDALLLGTLF